MIRILLFFLPFISYAGEAAIYASEMQQKNCTSNCIVQMQTQRKQCPPTDKSCFTRADVKEKDCINQCSPSLDCISRCDHQVAQQMTGCFGRYCSRQQQELLSHCRATCRAQGRQQSMIHANTGVSPCAQQCIQLGQQRQMGCGYDYQCQYHAQAEAQQCLQKCQSYSQPTQPQGGVTHPMGSPYGATPYAPQPYSTPMGGYPYGGSGYR